MRICSFLVALKAALPAGSCRKDAGRGYVPQGQYRTTPMRQIARKLNKVELRFFVRVHKFDAGGRAKTNSLFARQGKFVCYDGKYASR